MCKQEAKSLQELKPGESFFFGSSEFYVGACENDGRQSFYGVVGGIVQQPALSEPPCRKDVVVKLA